jgi:hypothetical protein
VAAVVLEAQVVILIINLAFKVEEVEIVILVVITLTEVVEAVHGIVMVQMVDVVEVKDMPGTTFQVGVHRGWD